MTVKLALPEGVTEATLRRIVREEVRAALGKPVRLRMSDESFRVAVVDQSPPKSVRAGGTIA